MAKTSLCGLGALAIAVGAALFSPSDARACGGCFQKQDESTIVVGHRMAFAVSGTRTVLWDQIQYTGNPTDFAWILPIKPGAYIELSTDAWFEALEAATVTIAYKPQVTCNYPEDYYDYGSSGNGCGVSGCGSLAAYEEFAGSGGGGGGGEPPPPPVTVVHRGTVGPYFTETLHANVPNVLPDWLTTNGYAIDPTVEPLINDYVAEGFDFIALRLKPNEGVQAMKPVRVVSDGMSPVLPLRMVAAGTGPSTALTLYVVGEGRWQAQGFANALVSPADVTWNDLDFSTDYAQLRAAKLAENQGETWLTSFALKGALLSQMSDPFFGTRQLTTSDGWPETTLGSLYFQQGYENEEMDPNVSTAMCKAAIQGFANAEGPVIDCSQGCTPVGTEIDSFNFTCDLLDDLSAALIGMHPRDVWVTRLEANLPRAALDTDLVIEAEPSQAGVDSAFFTGKIKNLDPNCKVTSELIAQRRDDAERKNRRDNLTAGAVSLAAIVIVIGRRIRRRRAVLSRA